MARKAQANLNIEAMQARKANMAQDEAVAKSIEVTYYLLGWDGTEGSCVMQEEQNKGAVVA